MQATVASRNENGESDKFSIDDGNFLDNNELSVDYSEFYGNDNFSGDYFGNSDVWMADANDTELYGGQKQGRGEGVKIVK